jgi:hypothetical protein
LGDIEILGDENIEIKIEILKENTEAEVDPFGFENKFREIGSISE